MTNLDELSKYPQLTHLYSLKDWELMHIATFEAIYITPEGGLFCLKNDASLKHIEFSELLYKHYKAVQEALKDQELIKSNFEDKIGNGIELSKMRSYYVAMLNDVKDVNKDLYDFALFKIREEMIPVQDLGFVKICSALGSLPAMSVPLAMFGHKATHEQLETAEVIIRRLQRVHASKDRDACEYVQDVVIETATLSSTLEGIIVEQNNAKHN